VVRIHVCDLSLALTVPVTAGMLPNRKVILVRHGEGGETGAERGFRVESYNLWDIDDPLVYGLVRFIRQQRRPLGKCTTLMLIEGYMYNGGADSPEMRP